MKIASKTKRSSASWKMRLAFAVVVIILLLGSGELFSRFLWAYRKDIKQGLGGSVARLNTLDIYEMSDPVQPENWLLKPGAYRRSEIFKEKKERGATLGMKRLGATKNQRDDPVVLRVGEHRFRGFLGDPVPEKGVGRLISIGDSCTFGPFLPGQPYPMVLERALNQRGVQVEVINAGVEGYRVENGLWILKQVLALRPDAVTLYLGWNDLYQPYETVSIGYYSRLYQVMFRGMRWFRKRVFGETAYAQDQLARVVENDPEALSVWLQKMYYVPTFIETYRLLVRSFKEAGVKPVILTLPGLYYPPSEQPFSERIIQAGHLPPTSDNAVAFAWVVHRYNQALIALAKEEQVSWIDLADWSVDAFKPRERYFIDGVHLSEVGYHMVGAYLASHPAILDVWKKK
ncbi:SGNH/GDSL hydrolase family protein [Magnetococcales bacterium HHB-1]